MNRKLYNFTWMMQIKDELNKFKEYLVPEIKLLITVPAYICQSSVMNQKPMCDQL